MLIKTVNDFVGGFLETSKTTDQIRENRRILDRMQSEVNSYRKKYEKVVKFMTENLGIDKP